VKQTKKYHTSKLETIIELSRDTAEVVIRIVHQKIEIQTRNTPYTGSTNFDNLNNDIPLIKSEFEIYNIKLSSYLIVV